MERSKRSRHTSSTTSAIDEITSSILRPVQFYDSSTRLANPERQLALAVLEAAAHDLRMHRYARARRAQRAYMEAYSWVASRDRSWPYSFGNLCEVVGLPTESLRERLLDGDSRSFSRAA